jgi:SHS2 domain-containing protein
MAKRRPSYAFIEHTGDLGVDLEAPSLEALFETAAEALFAVLVEGEAADRPAASVAVAASDREALLVDWLNELLFLHTLGGWVLRHYRVRLEGEAGLRAEVGGERFDPARHQARCEVKAATFHGLRLRREGGAWRGRVIFDL